MMTNARYARTDRVNQSMREVLGDELERIDDERLELVTVTGVHVDPDLRHAHVWFDTLRPVDEVVEALEEHRVRLQAAIGRQIRMKRTPGLAFGPDPAIAMGTRVEEILRGLHEGATEPEGEDTRPGLPPEAAKDGTT